MARSKKRRTPQHKITVPPAEWADVETAMKWDGVTNFSAFALAAVRQRVRRIKEQKARDEKVGA